MYRQAKSVMITKGKIVPLKYSRSEPCFQIHSYIKRQFLAHKDNFNAV